MNYLAICKDIRRESGIAGSGPAAVTSQNGILEKVVGWGAQAWVNIQTLDFWKFLRKRKVFTLSIGLRTYALEAAAPGMEVTDWRKWDEDGLFIEETTQDRTELRYEDWEKFRHRVISLGPGRPSIFSVNPEGEVEYDMIPDKAYVVRLEYWRTAVVLTANTDTPIIKPEFHKVIVWEGVLLYCGHDTATELYRHAREQRDKMLRRMELVYLPLPTHVAPHPLPGLSGS